MKKAAFALLLAHCALSAAFAQTSAFILPVNQRWQGRMEHTDVQGKRHSDLYEIVFVKGGTCIVSIRTRENGADLFIDGDGHWSESEDYITGASVLRVECEFPDSPLERLQSLSWTSFYQFDRGNARFTVTVPPYPDAKNNVRVQFVRTAGVWGRSPQGPDTDRVICGVIRRL